MQIKYGEFNIADTNTLPPVSLTKLLTGGLAHFLGNEVSSKVKAWEDRENKARQDAATKVGASTYDAVTTGEKDAQKAVVQKEAFADLLSGNVGLSNRGPRVDPLQAAMAVIARREVIKTLKSLDVKVPKGTEPVTFSDGKKKTMAEMIATRIAHPKLGPPIKAEAQKKLADEERALAKAKADMAKRDKAAPIDMDELGI